MESSGYSTMRYTEDAMNRMVKRSKRGPISLEDEIHFNLLNFIRVIHLNQQDFYSAAYNTQYYGDLEMEFMKEPNCLVGYCRATDNSNGLIYEYLFTENGFEPLENVLEF